MSNVEKVRVIPLGGLGEIGKNITAIECNDEIIVIDCGVAFPEEDMYGIDLVIPNISYLLDNKDKVSGIILTHGHEDHIGALPYVLKELNVPLYGTKLTLGLVEIKLQEHGILNDSTLRVVNAGQVVKTDNFNIEFIQNCHSIADSCSIAVHTPLGIIIHTGDFKIDYTPVDGAKMNFERFATLGKEKVLLLLADSTNVEREGHSKSESKIGENFERVFSTAKGRVIVATFASNIHRMQQIINASIKFGRKVAFSGRSMENVSEIAIELGYLNLPKEFSISVDEIINYPKDKITIITTGSQGEPMAALARIAFSTHRKIKVEEDDLFIISASPIPGNEKFISRVINELFKKGAEVIYSGIEEIHASGHAFQEELKLMHSLINPMYFMPVHGEYKHLIMHSRLAQKLGMDSKNIFIMETGEVLEITKDEVKKAGRVQSGAVFVDGLGVGDVGNIVLRDRKQLAEDGMVTVVVTIEMESYSIIAGPDIVTRGFVYARESEQLLNNAKDIVRTEIEKCLDNKITEWMVIKSNIKVALGQFLFAKTKRRPIIIPIIMEI